MSNLNDYWVAVAGAIPTLALAFVVAYRQAYARYTTEAMLSWGFRFRAMCFGGIAIVAAVCEYSALHALSGGSVPAYMTTVANLCVAAMLCWLLVVSGARHVYGAMLSVIGTPVAFFYTINLRRTVWRARRQFASLERSAAALGRRREALERDVEEEAAYLRGRAEDVARAEAALRVVANSAQDLPDGVSVDMSDAAAATELLRESRQWLSDQWHRHEQRKKELAALKSEAAQMSQDRTKARDRVDDGIREMRERIRASHAKAVADAIAEGGSVPSGTTKGDVAREH